MALLEKYEFCSHFRSSKSRLQGFLQQYVPNQKLSCLLVITWGSQLQTLARLHFDHRVQLAYHSHPYHNGNTSHEHVCLGINSHLTDSFALISAIHAADVAQTLHHFLSVGKLGESLPVRTKNATIIAALVHDMVRWVVQGLPVSTNSPLFVRAIQVLPTTSTFLSMTILLSSMFTVHHWSTCIVHLHFSFSKTRTSTFCRDSQKLSKARYALLRSPRTVCGQELIVFGSQVSQPDYRYGPRHGQQCTFRLSCEVGGPCAAVCHIGLHKEWALGVYLDLLFS